MNVKALGKCKDVNVALWTNSTATKTESSQLIYITAAVITEMFGYKMNSHKEPYPPWTRRLEAKIKLAQGKVANYGSCRRSCLRSAAG